jgi:uncharacterized protein YceK
VLTGVAAVLVFGCACGTVRNNSWPATNQLEMGRIYGGVRLDAKAIGEDAGSLVCPAPDDHESGATHATRIAFWTIDLPLSAAADTLALPFNIADTIRRYQDRGRPAGPFLPASAPPATADAPADH